MEKKQATVSPEVKRVHFALSSIAKLNGQMATLTTEASQCTLQNSKYFHEINKWLIGAGVVSQQMENTHDGLSRLLDNFLKASSGLEFRNTDALDVYLMLLNETMLTWSEYMGRGQCILQQNKA